MKSDLTLALCAYKDNPNIVATAESLAAQTVPVNVLVATSTPSEFIEGIARKYNWEYFVNPKAGEGIAADWEFAASCAKTKYVAIAHQDDIYFPEYAARVLDRFAKHPDSLMVFTNYCDLTDNGYQKNRSYLIIKRLLLWAYYIKPSWKNRLFKHLPICIGDAISCPSVTYNAEKLGGIRFDRSFSVNLDWSKWLELARMDGAFTYIPKCLMAHRIDEKMETRSAIQDHRRYNEDLRILTSIWGRRIASILIRLYARSYAANV